MKQNQPKALVLCEGKDDLCVIRQIAKHAGISDSSIEFLDYQGEANLRRFLSNLKTNPAYARGAYTKILITRDADQVYASAWQSLRDTIKAIFDHRLEKPSEWVTLPDGVQISGWIIPGIDQSGMIETICLDAARAADANAFSCLDPFIDCLNKSQGSMPHEKVRFAIWTIIAQGKTAKDRLSVERALKAVNINWDDASFSPLRNLLQELVE